MLPDYSHLGLLLSIVALAEPEDATEEERPSEGVEALLEAGEEEGILEESDRELVRSVVEFGDLLRRECNDAAAGDLRHAGDADAL